MTPVTNSRSVRLLALTGACAALFAVVLIWFGAASHFSSQVVAHSPVRAGWKTIDSHGVRFDIPSAWQRLDMSDCEFRFEQWAPPDSSPCGLEGGAVFYNAATFDPADGPGVRRTAAGGADAATWGGYVYAGDYAVYVSDNDRDLVRQALGSVRVAGEGE
jgi:hypothetical protein